MEVVRICHETAGVEHICVTRKQALERSVDHRGLLLAVRTSVKSTRKLSPFCQRTLHFDLLASIPTSMMSGSEVEKRARPSRQIHLCAYPSCCCSAAGSLEPRTDCFGVGFGSGLPLTATPVSRPRLGMMHTLLLSIFAPRALCLLPHVTRRGAVRNDVIAEGDLHSEALQRDIQANPPSLASSRAVL